MNLMDLTATLKADLADFESNWTRMLLGLDKADPATEKVQAGFAGLAAQMDKVSESADKTGGEADKAGTQIAGMGEKGDKALSPLEQRFGTLTQASSSLGGQITKLQRQLVGMLGVVSIPAAAFAAATSYGAAMKDVAVATGATGEQLASLGKSFRSILGNVASGADEVGTVMTELNVRLGLTGPVLEQISKKFLDWARITHSSVSEMTSEAPKMFIAWKVGAEDQARTLDYLMEVYRRTRVPVTQLMGTLTSMAPILRATGMDVEKSAAMMGLFAKASQEPGRGLMALNQAFRKFSSEGVKDVGEALADLIARIKAADNASQAAGIAQHYFGRGTLFLVEAIRSGAMDVDAFAKSVRDSAQPIEDITKGAEGFGSMLGKLRNQIGLALEPIGVGMVKAAKAMMESLTPLIASVSNLSSALGWVITQAPNTVAAIAAIGIAIKSATGGIIVAAAAGAKLGEWLQTLTPSYRKAEAEVQKMSDFLKAHGTILIRGGQDLATWADRVGEAMDKWIASQQAAKAAAEGTKAGLMDLQTAFDTLGLKSIKELRRSLDQAKEALVSVENGMKTGTAMAADYHAAQAKVFVLQDELNRTMAGYATQLDVAKRSYDNVLRAYQAGHSTVKKLGEAQEALWKAQKAADPRHTFPAWEAAVDRYEDAYKAVEKLLDEFNNLAAGMTKAEKARSGIDPTKIPWTAGLDAVQEYIELVMKVAKAEAGAKESTLALEKTFATAMNAMRAKAKEPIVIDVEEAQREYNAILDLYIKGLATIQQLLVAGAKLAAMKGPAWMTKLVEQIQKAKAAFDLLNIKSTAELEKFAKQAQKAYEDIWDNARSTMRDITMAWVAAERAQLEATLARGKLTKEEYADIIRRVNQLHRAEEVLANQTEILTKTIETGWQRAGQQISTVRTDLSRALADLIMAGGKFKDVMVNALEEVAKALLRTAIEAQLKRITDLFKGLGTTGGVWGKIGQVIFGGGGAAGGGVAATTAGGGAGATAGGVGGAVGGGLAGILTAAFTGVSAVTGVIGAFQTAGMNKSLDLIEHETRYAQIHLLNILDRANTFWPALKDIIGYLWGTQTPYLQKICAAVESNFTGGVPVTINIYETSDARTTAREVVTELRRLGVVPG